MQLIALSYLGIINYLSGKVQNIKLKFVLTAIIAFQFFYLAIALNSNHQFLPISFLSHIEIRNFLLISVFCIHLLWKENLGISFSWQDFIIWSCSILLTSLFNESLFACSYQVFIFWLVLAFFRKITISRYFGMFLALDIMLIFIKQNVFTTSSTNILNLLIILLVLGQSLYLLVKSYEKNIKQPLFAFYFIFINFVEILLEKLQISGMQFTGIAVLLFVILLIKSYELEKISGFFITTLYLSGVFGFESFVILFFGNNIISYIFGKENQSIFVSEKKDVFLNFLTFTSVFLPPLILIGQKKSLEFELIFILMYSLLFMLKIKEYILRVSRSEFGYFEKLFALSHFVVFLIIWGVVK